MITFRELGNIPYFGRLGNQLWEIASTIGIADSLNIPFYFPTWTYSRYFKHELPQKSYDELFSPRTKTFTEKQFNYEAIILDTRYDWDLIGYYQSWKYFVNSFDKVRYYFDFNFEICDYIIGGVAIHIRRCDYLDRKRFHTCLTETDYYQKAMEMFPKDTTFSIFSDDIEWCKTFIKGNNIIYVSPLSDISDLNYMTQFKNHIISNSSYSWWGAFLKKQEGITIAPRQWFAPKVTDNANDLYLEGWIVI